MKIKYLWYFVVKSLINFSHLMSKIIKKVLFLHRSIEKFIGQS